MKPVFLFILIFFSIESYATIYYTQGIGCISSLSNGSCTNNILNTTRDGSGLSRNGEGLTHHDTIVVQPGNLIEIVDSVALSVLIVESDGQVIPQGTQGAILEVVHRIDTNGIIGRRTSPTFKSLILYCTGDTDISGQFGILRLDNLIILPDPSGIRVIEIFDLFSMLLEPQASADLVFKNYLTPAPHHVEIRIASTAYVEIR